MSSRWTPVDRLLMVTQLVGGECNWLHFAKNFPAYSAQNAVIL